MSDIIQILYGDMELVIKPPCIVERLIKRRFWFDKIEYWIELEFVSMGPFSNYNEAQSHLFMMDHAEGRQRQ
jgi:hypothetical protein